MGAAELKSFTDKDSSKQVPKLPDFYCFSSRKWAKEGVCVIWHKTKPSQSQHRRNFSRISFETAGNPNFGQEQNDILSRTYNKVREGKKSILLFVRGGRSEQPVSFADIDQGRD